ncbi:MAG: hypothetical protein IKN33_05995 [Selenomonadaceae bacterium]|nr:hypothetical protein [Selenomonadaceae bacterium]
MTLDEWIEIDRKRRATLNAEFAVSANTLAMMDSAMQNFVNGGASDPIDPSDFEEDEQDSLE